jgi:hypothetical protein
MPNGTSRARCASGAIGLDSAVMTDLLVRGVVVAVVVCSAARAGAQPGEGRERITVRSAVLKEERTIYVRVPRHAAGGARYPVIYLTDGETQFAHTVATIGFLARNGRVPEMDRRWDRQYGSHA